MTIIAPAVLTALGQLNVHARAHSPWDTSRHAIYSYKRLASLLLVEAEVAPIDFVRWTGKCAHCTDGCWCSGYPDDRKSRCRHCSGAGQVTLKFTRVTLPDGQQWMHPWQGQTAPGIDIAKILLGAPFDSDTVHWLDAVDWSPGGRTEPLGLEQVVTNLNLVEAWVEAVPDRERGSEFWWFPNSAKRCLHQQKHPRVRGDHEHAYRLDIGLAPGGCWKCGSPDNLVSIRIGRLSPLFHWCQPVCETHYRTGYPTDPPPAALLAPAYLQTWIERHSRVVEEP